MISGRTVIVVAASATIAGTLSLIGVAHADDVYDFQSPSGNIACNLGGALNGGVECDIGEFTYRVPPHPANCQQHFGDRFALDPGQVAVMMCHGDTVRVPGMQTLNYGQRLSIGPVSCDSEQAGMTCTDAGTGHYFRVARDSYELH